MPFVTHARGEGATQDALAFVLMQDLADSLALPAGLERIGQRGWPAASRSAIIVIVEVPA